MPLGCLHSLIAFALGCMAGFYLIGNTKIQDQYWIPFVYGGLSMLTYLNLWGIVQAWQKKRSFKAGLQRHLLKLAGLMPY